MMHPSPAEASSTGRTRHWGTDEWSSRVFQGTYYNWVSANAMLPDVDLEHEGIQKIDRTTVPEINELVTSASKLVTLSTGEQAHLNPLGLAADAMSFDISPAEVAAGKSHFEQIYDRATTAAVTAKNAFEQAGKMNQMLRRQNNSQDDYNEAVDSQEDAYEYQLITLFGTAYAGDIGPGKLYAQGYTGPDLYHSYFIDRPSLLVDTGTDIPALIAALNNLSAAQVNAEVLDVLTVDTFAQPGQESPAATTTLGLMVRYLYKAFRNRKTQTATTYALYADDTTTVDQKSTVSDDGTTFSAGEIATGP